MKVEKGNILAILLPALVLILLMASALIHYPAVFHQSPSQVITVFIVLILYVFLWRLLRPDSLSKNGGWLIGCLFIVNISAEDFVNWPTHTSNLVATLVMMFLIFISFAIISAIKTMKGGLIIQGIKSSFISALSGTLIALCFGFLINYLFPQRMVDILRNDPGFKDYSNPIAYTFLNAFDNASSHIIVAPVISIIMGTLGGLISLFILRIRKRNHLSI